MTTKRIGFFIYPRFAPLDLVGPHEAFISANLPDGSMAYETVIFSLAPGAVTSESGITVQVQATYENVGPLDTVIIPGGKGLREPDTQRKVANWLSTNAPSIRRVATVCTGIYGLCASGLADGRRVTTHWAFAADVAKKFPMITMVDDELYLNDGRYYTSAGVTAGIDLALAMIEQDYGSAISLAVARELVVYLKRPGGQKQFSELLKYQAQAVGPCEGIVEWITANLRSDLSLETIAKQANLSTRQLSRQFVESFGISPAKFVEQVRLDEARTLLANDNSNMAGIAAAVGFANPDSFRRAFLRRFGVSPSHYRAVFTTT